MYILFLLMVLPASTTSQSLKQGKENIHLGWTSFMCAELVSELVRLASEDRVVFVVSVGIAGVGRPIFAKPRVSIGVGISSV